MTQPGASSPSVRLLFEIAREDNPRLYDDLMRFNKGPKRVNRLRFLAYEGLLAQLGIGVVARSGGAMERERDADSASQVVQAFDLPSDA
ncbi:hypothetical protein [Pseudomonas sp. 18175]|uniref:hypothetical protein n=1 Tax=Pseudomonas sp. 18175 TaxID=3390056 RepID=UPI003D1FD7C6